MTWLWWSVYLAASLFWVLWRHPFILALHIIKYSVSQQMSSRYLDFITSGATFLVQAQNFHSQAFIHWFISLQGDKRPSIRLFFCPHIPMYKPQMGQGQVGHLDSSLIGCALWGKMIFQEGFKPQYDILFQRPKAFSHAVCHIPSGGSSGGWH